MKSEDVVIYMALSMDDSSMMTQDSGLCCKHVADLTKRIDGYYLKYKSHEFVIAVTDCTDRP